jgi:hypothetical protein
MKEPLQSVNRRVVLHRIPDFAPATIVILTEAVVF